MGTNNEHVDNCMLIAYHFLTKSDRVLCCLLLVIGWVVILAIRSFDLAMIAGLITD